MSIETIFTAYADAGYCLALVFDDDGRWAVSDSGSSPLPDTEDGHTKPCFINSYVKPEQWKPTIRAAVEAFQAANPLAAADGVAPSQAPSERVVIQRTLDTISALLGDMEGQGSRTQIDDDLLPDLQARQRELLAALGVTATSTPEPCEFPVCAVHHICDRNCTRNAGVMAVDPLAGKGFDPVQFRFVTAPKELQDALIAYHNTPADAQATALIRAVLDAYGVGGCDAS